MDRTRLWIIGSVLAMVVVVVLGWLVGVQPQLDQAATASDQTTQVENAAATNQAVLTKMKKDSDNLPELKKQLADLAASMPKKREVSDWADELTDLATANGLTVMGMTEQDGTDYKSPEQANPPAAQAPTTGTGSASTPTPTPTPTPAAAGATAPAAGTGAAPAGAPPAASPLVVPGTLTFVPMSFSVRGSEDQILAFVGAAQKTKRLFLVDGLEINPAPTAGTGYDAKVSGFIYALSTGVDPATAK